MTPIALFVYRRPEHTKEVLSALASCPESAASDVVVFSDGPRGETQRTSVDATRAILHSTTGFRSVRLVERRENIGLFQNVVQGLDEMFSFSESVIVLEDDIEVTSDFLSYMNAGLAHYSRNHLVSSITGFLYPAHFTFPATSDSFLFPRFCCWGWATWRRVWEQIDLKAPSRSSFMNSKDLFWRFWQASNDLPEIMLDLIEGKNDSWSILFNYWQVQNEKYCVYPTRTRAANIGFDGSGTHSGRKRKYEVEVTEPNLAPGEGGKFQFADTVDEQVSEPLHRYFQNRMRRKIKNLVRYGRYF